MNPKLQVLDADKKKLTDRTGRQAVRDIVQYMQFSKYNGDGIALATELLAELPGQFLQWVRYRMCVESLIADDAMACFDS